MSSNHPLQHNVICVHCKQQATYSDEGPAIRPCRHCDRPIQVKLPPSARPSSW